MLDPRAYSPPPCSLLVVINATSRVENGSSVDSVDVCNLALATIGQFHLPLTVLQAAPPQKKIRNTGTTPTPTPTSIPVPAPTPTPRAETTTESSADTMDIS